MKYREASKKLGTLRAVIRQLGLDWKEFTDAK